MPRVEDACRTLAGQGLRRHFCRVGALRGTCALTGRVRGVLPLHFVPAEPGGAERVPLKVPWLAPQCVWQEGSRLLTQPQAASMVPQTLTSTSCVAGNVLGHTRAQGRCFLPRVMPSGLPSPSKAPPPSLRVTRPRRLPGRWPRGPYAPASLYNLAFPGTPGTGVTPTSRLTELLLRLLAEGQHRKRTRNSLPVPPFTGSFYRVRSPRQGSGGTEEERVRDRQPRLCSVQAPVEPLGPRGSLHGT